MLYKLQNQGLFKDLSYCIRFFFDPLLYYDYFFIKW